MLERLVERRDIFREGVWCIADIGTDKYKALGKKSQAANPWGYQAHYGHCMVYFMAVIIALFIIKNLIYIFTDKHSLVTKRNSRNSAKNLYYKVSAFNRWFSYRRFPAFVCNIFQLPSSFGNFLVITAGLLYVLCYSFIPKVWYRACRGFGSPPLAVRTGLESIAFIPVIFILSGKTNTISNVTGISYEKINVYHRWVSFICCFLAWVHTVAFYVQAVREGGSERLAYMQRTNIYYVNGIPPLVFLTVLTIFSHSYIRAMWYELWLQIHWICALGLYISLFIHAYNSMDSNNYMIAAIVFWGTQLIWRAVNKAFLRPNKGFLKSNSCKMRRYASNSAKDHYFEIAIENSNDFTWSPGQHLFLRVPGLRFLENHPFSIVSYCNAREENDIKLIIKACGWGGLTKELYEKLPDTGYTDSTIFIDGPYGGCERPVEAFNNAYLLASGTGISAILPFLTDICVKMRNEKMSILENVTLNWSIRNAQNLEWIFEELKNIVDNYSDLISDNKVKINIYVAEEIGTESNDFLTQLQSSDSDSDEKSSTQSQSKQLQFINIVNEKCDFKKLVENLRGSLGQRNIFIVSGSDSMKISSCNSVAGLQSEIFTSQNVDEIYLHSESFGW